MAVKAREILAAHEESIRHLCSKYSVRRLRLFGSAAGEAWNEASSDFDFLVEFDNPVDMSAYDQLTGLLVELEAVLERHVDLVDWQAAKNPFFRRHVEQNATELYAA